MMKSCSFISSLVVCAFVAGGCATGRMPVKQYGRMHDVLSGGAENARARVTLAAVLEEPGACGVGALAGLEGEVTILDGNAWVSRPAGAKLRVDGPLPRGSEEEAALLTVAHVDGWRSVKVDGPLAGRALEEFIGRSARLAGLDPGEPFPFVLEGMMTDLQLHVINGDCPMRPGAKLGSEHSPWRRELSQPTSGKIVGFHAVDSVGNLTHPGTSIHAHALLSLDGQLVTGHVERIAVGADAVLKLPVVK